MLAAVILVALLLVAPLLLVDVPPVMDYPNHLARLFLLAHGREDPVLAPMFTVHWRVIPNLAIDLVGPPLMWILPVHVVGRLLLAALLLLPFAGVLALHRAIFGRVHPWALACALLMASGAFLLGFLNFVAALGAALLLVAFWIAGRQRWPMATIVLATLGSAALFFCHLMGVVFALALIGAWEARSLRGLLAAAPLAIVPALLYLAAPLGDMPGGPVYLPIDEKLWQMLAPFVAYNHRLDLLAAVAVALFMLACAAWRRLDAPPGIRIALAGLALLYAASPYAFKGTYSFDTRFASMFVLVLFAGVRPRGLPRWLELGATAGFAAIFLARTAVLALAWHAHADDLAQLRTVMASVTPGERVFVASVAPNEAPAYWATVPTSRRFSNDIRSDTHLPALLMIERRAFWPLLFDRLSQQPVALTPHFHELAVQNDGLTDHLAVDPAALCGFDRLLLLGSGGDPGYTDPHLERGTTTDAAAIFRVRPETLICPPG